MLSFVQLIPLISEFRQNLTEKSSMLLNWLLILKTTITPRRLAHQIRVLLSMAQKSHGTGEVASYYQMFSLMPGPLLLANFPHFIKKVIYLFFIIVNSANSLKQFQQMRTQEFIPAISPKHKELINCMKSLGWERYFNWNS